MAPILEIGIVLDGLPDLVPILGRPAMLLNERGLDPFLEHIAAARPGLGTKMPVEIHHEIATRIFVVDRFGADPVASKTAKRGDLLLLHDECLPVLWQYR
jgi:hypothetical protein